MKLKKINAILGLLFAVSCLAHVALKVYYFTTYNEAILPQVNMSSHICAGTGFIHIFISLYMLIFVHEIPKIKCAYSKENIRTTIQRVSGIMMFVLLFLHFNLSNMIISIQGKNAGYYVIVALVMALFFGTVFLHVAVSLTRALITLGIISSRKTQRKIDIVIWILMGLAFLVTSGLMIYSGWNFFNMGGGA